jgi:hypothetical protein
MRRLRRARRGAPAPPATNKAILDHFTDARVLGVTATPRRADGKARLLDSRSWLSRKRDGLDSSTRPWSARRSLRRL